VSENAALHILALERSVNYNLHCMNWLECGLNPLINYDEKKRINENLWIEHRKSSK
jgi:hypothetical protein